MPPSEQDDTTREKIIARGKRLARVRNNFYKTATEAAKNLNVAVPTYSSHENGTRVIKDHVADIYARHFGISTEWLMHGNEPEDRGEPPDPTAVMAQTSNQRVMERNPLLALYDVFRSPTGYLPTPTSDKNKVVDLHPFNDSDGHIVELTLKDSTWDRERRLINIPGQGNNRLFLLQSFISVGALSANVRFLVAFRLPASDLFEADNLLIVDPTDRFPSADGIYVLVRGQKLLPVFVPAPEISFGEDEASEVEFFLKRGGKKNVLKKNDFEEMCIGRCLTVVHTMRNDDIFYQGFNSN